MDREFNLIVDSCCDLPADFVAKDGVEVLNFTFNMEGADYVDDFFQSMEPHDFYENMRFGVSPTTSQIAPLRFEEILGKYVDSELPVLSLCFSSGLSGSYDGACMVADALRSEHPDFDLRVVDTKLASIAEGSLVLEIMELQAAGWTIDQAVSWVDDARARHNCMFMVDDLEALSRGGRIPSTVASIGSVLDVKPMLSIADDGTLSMCGVSRGRKKGIKALSNHLAKNMPDGKDQEKLRVIVGHSDCPDDAERLCGLVRKIAPKAEVFVSSIGPVIGSHVGPGMLAISFIVPKSIAGKAL